MEVVSADFALQMLGQLELDCCEFLSSLAKVPADISLLQFCFPFLVMLWL